MRDPDRGMTASASVTRCPCPQGGLQTSDTGPLIDVSLFTGPNSIHPTPPTPEYTLLGVGGRIEEGGGGNKIPAAGGFKIYPPHPEKCPLGQKLGEGAGFVYNISPGLFASFMVILVKFAASSNPEC